MVVVLVHVELDLATGVGVTKTELGAGNISILQTLQQLLSVGSDTTEEVGSNVAGVGSLGVNAGEGSLDGTTQVLVLNSESDGRLGGGLGQVELEVGSEVLVQDTLGDIVDVLESVGSVSTRGELSIGILARGGPPNPGCTHLQGAKLTSWTILPKVARFCESAPLMRSGWLTTLNKA